MGKTYRYEPFSGRKHTKESSTRASFVTNLDDKCWNELLECAQKTQFHPISRDPEQQVMEMAINMMHDRVDEVVSGFVAGALIQQYEHEDYVSIINAHICRALLTFDPSKKGKNGKKSSLSHFLWVVIDNIAFVAREYLIKRREMRLNTGSIDKLEEEDEDELENLSSDDNSWLSDGCKSVEELILKMDLQVLGRMLTEEEMACLSGRIQGVSDAEIADRLGNGADRYHIQKVVIPRIQEKARKCGFIPRSEVEGNRARKEGSSSDV